MKHQAISQILSHAMTALFCLTGFAVQGQFEFSQQQVYSSVTRANLGAGLNFAKFDPSLGTLRSVQIEFSVQTSFSAYVSPHPLGEEMIKVNGGFSVASDFYSTPEGTEWSVDYGTESIVYSAGGAISMSAENAWNYSVWDFESFVDFSFITGQNQQWHMDVLMLDNIDTWLSLSSETIEQSIVAVVTYYYEAPEP